MFFRLGLLGDYTVLLSGRSNAGLTEPGQNAAFSLTQLAAVVCMTERSFDDLVVGAMIVMLKNEIPQAFGAADRQLRMDDKKLMRQETRAKYDAKDLLDPGGQQRKVSEK